MVRFSFLGQELDIQLPISQNDVIVLEELFPVVGCASCWSALHVAFFCFPFDFGAITLRVLGLVLEREYGCCCHGNGSSECY